MGSLTLQEVYDFLGIKRTVDEHGRPISWSVTESQKLDLEFGRLEFSQDGRVFIKIPFTIEEIKEDA